MTIKVGFPLVVYIVLVAIMLTIVVSCAPPPPATSGQYSESGMFEDLKHIIRYEDTVSGVTCYYIQEVPETFQCLDTTP